MVVLPLLLVKLPMVMLPLSYPLVDDALLVLAMPVVSLALSVCLYLPLSCQPAFQLLVCLQCCQLVEAIVVELPLVLLASSMDTR